MYHALLKSRGMYPSDWSSGMYSDQIVGGNMLLSWYLAPNNRDGVAYLLARCLDTAKASLRFARPLPATTSLIAYAQCHNLVVVDTYRRVTFDYNP